jgi:lysophospholipase L1-like esterase
LATVVDTIKQHLPSAKIVLAATIAPNATVFGDGAPGLSFDAQGKQQKVNTILSYLDSTIKFAQSQHLPIADVYHKSLGSQRNGKLEYINGGDHIHYSDAGRMLFAETILDTLMSNHVLE